VPWLLPNRILSNKKARSAPGPNFAGIAFPPTQNSFGEVAIIAVNNGKAIS
jgi:hypothetical protein